MRLSSFEVEITSGRGTKECIQDSLSQSNQKVSYYIYSTHWAVHIPRNTVWGEGVSAILSHSCSGQEGRGGRVQQDKNEPLLKLLWSTNTNNNKKSASETFFLYKFGKPFVFFFSSRLENAEKSENGGNQVFHRLE